MSTVVSGLAKALYNKEFKIEDTVGILGMKTVDTPKGKIDSFSEAQFKRSNGKDIDVYLAGSSLLAVTFTTKTNEKLVYSRYPYEPKIWNLIKTVTKGISYHPVMNQQEVNEILVNGDRIVYHPKAEKPEVLDISI